MPHLAVDHYFDAALRLRRAEMTSKIGGSSERKMMTNITSEKLFLIKGCNPKKYPASVRATTHNAAPMRLYVKKVR